MTIGINGTPLFRDKMDGVGRYTFEITKRLASNHKLLIIGFNEDKGKTPIKHKNVEYLYLPFKRRLYGITHKTKYGLPINKYLNAKLDFVLYPNFINTPYIKGLPYAVVIHDLAYIKYPDTVSNRNRKYLNRRVPGAIKNAKFVVAVSENTKKELFEEFNISEAKIIVAPNGIDTEPYKNITAKDMASLKHKYNLPDTYLLFLGSVEPRKNLINVLKAYERFGKDAIPLVIAGSKGWNNKEIKEKLDDLRADGFNINTPGYINNKDVPTLYAAARVFVFPSLHEGFGLPILESMAAGTPVITSNKPPMSDLVTNKSLLVNPTDFNDIYVKMINALTNKNKSSSIDILNQYNWDSSAKIISDSITSLFKKV